MKPKIIYTNSGIASNYGEWIEINDKIKSYPYLHKEILKHELGHTNKKGFSWYDLKHDFFAKPKMILWIYYFCIRHPSALSQYIPINLRKGKVYYDFNLILTYSILLIFILIYYLLRTI
jgi:hypothetical protein